MKEVMLFDPARVPHHWRELMAPGDFAVFIVDHRSGQPLSSSGTPLSSEKATCILFRDRTSADEFCSRIVSSFRGARCEIYDSEGKAKAPLRIYLDPSLPKEEFRRWWWGFGLIAVGFVMLIYDSTTRWDAIWPTAAGLKLVLAGVVWVLWNPLKWLARKQR